MSIRYECDQCGSVLKIKDDLAGKPGKCPKCKRPFTVPVDAEDTDNSAAATAAEPLEEAESMLAEGRPLDSNGDFDVDAFLSSDVDSEPKPRPKASQSSRSDRDFDADQSLDEPAEKAKTKRSKSRSGEGSGEEVFQIRRGPDAIGKSDHMDGVPGETPTPSRRPPGTNPNAAAANIASDLLSMSAKKGKKTNWSEVEAEKNEKPKFDWEGLGYEARTKLLPVLGGGAVVCLVVYFLVFPMFASKTYVPKMATVTGIISVNGKPLTGAQVFFHPTERKHEVNGKFFKVTASFGQTDANGRYELTYDKEHKGVVVGKCRIEIAAADITGIHPKYYKNDKDAATLEVSAGNQTVNLELSQ